MRRLTRWLSSPQGEQWYHRGLAIFLTITLATCFVLLVVSLIQGVPRWVTEWQGAHGHYPTGHLTYTVPEQWDATTLTGLSPSQEWLWWSIFDDRVTAISRSYTTCPPNETCAAGARIDLESASGEAYPTLDAWYRHWAESTDSYFGDGAVLPLADYTAVPLGGQRVHCASNQDGSQLLPPHPPTSPHFNATFPSYSPPFGNVAVVMCFTLWHGRVYHLEATVELYTSTQDSDLQNAAKMIDSLRFT